MKALLLVLFLVPIVFADKPATSNPSPSRFALRFNGVDADRAAGNFVTLPDTLSHVLPRGFTFEAWIKLQDSSDAHHTTYRPIVSRFNPRLTQGPQILNWFADFVLQVDAGTGRLTFFMGGETDYGMLLQSTDAIPDQQWVHVAFSVASTTYGEPFSASLFVNDKEINQMWKQGTRRRFLPTERIYLGYYANELKQYFEGTMDEVRFWNTAQGGKDIVARMSTPLSVIQNPDLTAYYRFDSREGTTLQDSTLRHHDGFITGAIWTLSSPLILNERASGIAGYPVDIALTATDIDPTVTDYEFALFKLPEFGGIFSPDEEPLRLVDNRDLQGRTVFPSVVHYAGLIDYNGPDSFSYAARPVGDTGVAWSKPVTVIIDVIDPPEDGCIAGFDKCGICGGDDSSCTTGGCDGHGSQLDSCGVCGGDDSSCTCESYKTYTTDEMDCVLFEHAINKTISRIDYAMSVLIEMMERLQWYNGDIDLLVQLKHLCSIDPCLEKYVEEISLFQSYIDEAMLESCDEPSMDFDPNMYAMPSM